MANGDKNPLKSKRQIANVMERSGNIAGPCIQIVISEHAPDTHSPRHKLLNPQSTTALHRTACTAPAYCVLFRAGVAHVRPGQPVAARRHGSAPCSTTPLRAPSRIMDSFDSLDRKALTQRRPRRIVRSRRRQRPTGKYQIKNLTALVLDPSVHH